MKLDRISELADHIIEEILGRLPIGDAVRTSLLSSKWRHKWTATPSLEFSLTSWRRTFNSTEELVSTIDHVLSQHVGPIHKFKFYHNAVGPINKLYNHYECSLPDRDIDRWILHLSRSHVKELSLIFYTRQRYTLPCCIFFSYQHLTRLKLSSCTLRPPATFKGFVNLKSLELRSVNLAQDVFEIIISSSPVLERVCLAGLSKDVRNINLDAPNLRFFKFESDKFTEITFRNTSSLAVVSIFLPYLYPKPKIQVSHIPKFFDHLSHIQRLEVSGSFLEYLALGGLPKEYPLHNLRYLSMVVKSNHLEDILTAICLLRSAPNLEELFIADWEDCNIEDVDPNFSEAKHMNCQFTKLRQVSIANIIGRKVEIDFINYVLSTSPMLERLTIKLVSSHYKSMVEKSLSFELASNRVEIVILNTDN